MAEPAATPGKSESMEDILQSIKRIIEDEPAGDKKPAEAAPAAADDVLDLTQMVKDDGTVTSVEPPAAAAPPPTASPPPPPPPPPKKPASKKPMETPATEKGDLVSEEAASAAAAALQPIVESTQKDLSIPRVASPELRNGNTVEDLMLEALRPMLKSWLDENLPMIVQKIVEKEVKRIITFRQD